VTPEELKEDMKFVFNEKAKLLSGTQLAGIEGIITLVAENIFRVSYATSVYSVYNQAWTKNQVTIDWFDWEEEKPEGKPALTPLQEEEKYRKARHEDMKHLFTD